METGYLYFNGEPLTFNSNLITFGGAGGGGPENTFGLPADVVALVTSRFGSVANYLRLRNLGII